MRTQDIQCRVCTEKFRGQTAMQQRGAHERFKHPKADVEEGKRRELAGEPHLSTLTLDADPEPEPDKEPKPEPVAAHAGPGTNGHTDMVGLAHLGLRPEAKAPNASEHMRAAIGEIDARRDWLTGEIERLTAYQQELAALDEQRNVLVEVAGKLTPAKPEPLQPVSIREHRTGPGTHAGSLAKGAEA